MIQLLCRSLTLLMVTLVSLSACKGDEMQLYGKVSTIEYAGQTCWVFMDENNNAYEIITGSSQVLQPGMRAEIRAVEVNRKTSCQLPTVIDIVSYRPISDMPDAQGLNSQ
jgi:hypothetical protein